MHIAYLNGEFIPLEGAKVSALDRGFTFGDGVYEVIPVYGGHLLRLDEHLVRLENSLAAIRISNPCPNREWVNLLLELVERNGGGDQAVYLQVTRGVAMRSHAFPTGVFPTIFAMSLPRETGAGRMSAKAVTRTDNRWLRCDVKAIALLANVLLRQEAEEAGAAECILVRDGFVTEGAVSNVFVVKAGHVKTPPKSPLLLPGITRDLVLELMPECGFSCVESPLSEDELRDADEIWITGSTIEVRAVVELDGVSVGSGRPGPLWEATYSAFESYTNRTCREKLDSRPSEFSS